MRIEVGKGTGDPVRIGYWPGGRTGGGRKGAGEQGSKGAGEQGSKGASENVRN
jgi:hypothetical protein